MLILGGLTLDWVRDDLGTRGPTPGGNALYAAVGAWLAGADVVVGAVVGTDYPHAILDRLEDHGIGTDHVRRVDGPSFRVQLDNTGAERLITYRQGSGKNAELDPIPDQLPAAGAIAGAHIAAIPTASQAALVAALVDRAPVITLDTVVIPGEIEPDLEALLAVARRCTAFLPSREEVAHLWPDLDPMVDVCDLSRGGPSINVIKLGAAGSIGCDRGTGHHVPAFATTALDTTGAGDSYCGAVCAALARGDALPVAMAWGSAAASLVVEHVGCEPLLRDRVAQETARRAERVLEQTMQRRTA